MAASSLRAAIGLLVLAGLAAPPAGSTPPCSRKNCKEEILACEAAAACDGLSANARSTCHKECVQQALAGCEAGRSLCTPPTPCSGGSVPECAGVCPPSEECEAHLDFAPFFFGCVCFPAGVTPCLESAYPQCGGTCFEGDVCQAIHVGPDERGDARLCACVSPNATCGPPPPETCQSAGVCPLGSACHSQFVGTPQLEVCGCDAP